MVLLAKIARAVHHAHQRVVLHRDLKPGNVLLDEAGEPHLIDFGIAKCLEQDLGATQTGDFIGTPAYASPEQVAGQTKSITTASDTYGLGAILYAVLTGQPPFTGNSVVEIIEKVKNSPPPRIRQVRPNIAADLETICLKCLEKEPSRRYASALALALDLECFLERKPISARAVGVFERLWMWVKRHPIHAALAGAMSLVLVLSIFGILFWFDAQTSRGYVRQIHLLDQIQRTRLIERSAGWSARAWKMAAEAASIPHIETSVELRNQAAAVFSGFDATGNEFTNVGPVHVSFEKEGRNLLMDDWGGRGVQLRDLQTGEASRFAPTNIGPVWFTSSGEPRQFASAGRGEFVLLDLNRREILRDFRMPVPEIPDDPEASVMAVSPDGALCAAASSSSTGQLAVWEVATGKLLKQSAEVVTAMAFSPDNSCVATGDSERRVRIRSLPTLDDVVVPFHEARVQIDSLGFQQDVARSLHSAEGAMGAWLVAAGDAGGTIRIYGTRPRNVRALAGGSYHNVYAVAFSPDNMTLASSGRGEAYLWDVRNLGAPLLTIPHMDYAMSLAFSPDGTRLAIGCKPGFTPNSEKLTLFDLEPGRGIMALRGFSARSTHLAFSNDGQRLAAVAHNWEVGVWHLASNRLEHLFEAPKGIVADNAALAFSRDDQRLAFATWKSAILWDLGSGACSNRWEVPEGLVQRLCFDREGRLLLFQWDDWRSETRMCRVRNLSSHGKIEVLAQIPQIKARVEGALFSQNGDFLAVITEPARRQWQVTFLNPVSGQQLQRLPGAVGGGSLDADALRMNPETAILDYYLPRPQVEELPGSIQAVSPDGRVLLLNVGEERGRMLLWKERPEQPLTLGIDHVLAHWPQFSPNGKHLAVGTAEGTVLVFNIAEITGRLQDIGLGWR